MFKWLKRHFTTLVTVVSVLVVGLAVVMGV